MSTTPSSEIIDAIREAVRGATSGATGDYYQRPPKDVWASLAKADLISLALPEQLGGEGLASSHSVLCALFEQAGMALAHRPLYSGLALGALPLAEHFDAALVAGSIAAQSEGRSLTVGAFTEGATASWSPTTTLDVDARRLTGSKSFVWDAGDADDVLISARTAEGRHALVHIPMSRDGVTLASRTTTDQHLTFEITLDDVPVLPGEWVLLDPAGTGLAGIRRRAELLLASTLVGAAATALDLTVHHVRERRQFGRPLGSFQAVAMRAADAWIQLEVARASIDHAATLPTPSTLADAAAAVWALRAAAFTIDAAHHLHGGVGVGLDYPLWKFTRSCRQLELTLGSEAHHVHRAQTALAG